MTILATSAAIELQRPGGFVRIQSRKKTLSVQSVRVEKKIHSHKADAKNAAQSYFGSSWNMQLPNDGEGNDEEDHIQAQVDDTRDTEV